MYQKIFGGGLIHRGVKSGSDGFFWFVFGGVLTPEIFFLIPKKFFVGKSPNPSFPAIIFTSFPELDPGKKIPFSEIF